MGGLDEEGIGYMHFICTDVEKMKKHGVRFFAGTSVDTEIRVYAQNKLGVILA